MQDFADLDREIGQSRLEPCFGKAADADGPVHLELVDHQAQMLVTKGALRAKLTMKSDISRGDFSSSGENQILHLTIIETIMNEANLASVSMK